ncbi:N-acetylglucosamine kinase [Brevibacillus composti]|uniref:N-acetylglucosamine kinase n=1 Tax=Brevibacillus composti TaxID=2796470 RepID=A0A7T5JPS3_9BACL|nr:BadF/BadG/BcrA/BcrD ATPase family protein [Brevibacillus composti]QQE75405.1 N-acetylglucosamine kinase [Brevibacillus composti]QUO42431.1 N-acetylglucosamine kinase [Brevibacillus composti]
MAGRRIPLLAIDGGGTKCLAVLADRSGRILGTGRAGACNYQGIGREAAAEELVSAIEEALRSVSEAATRSASPAGQPAAFQDGQSAGSHVGNSAASPAGQPAASPAQVQAESTSQSADGAADAPLEDAPLEDAKTGWEIDCAVFGMAGLDTDYDRQVIEEIVACVLEKLHIQARHLIVENDGFAALLGATGGDAGILVIAGTGSIAFGVNQAGDTARAGGWGHRVGDEGSGYWIGKQAVTAVLKAADGRGEPTMLTGLLLPHFGVNRVEELFNWMYGPAYAVEKVGELSPLVSQAAKAGDRVAGAILRAAGEELFLAARAVMDRLAMKDQPFKMILQGGVLQHDERVRSLVIERISRHSPRVTFDKAENEPIYGVIAKGLAWLNRSPTGNRGV